MATLSVKNVPDRLYKKLQARAKRQYRSISQEVIAILDSAERTDRARPRASPLEWCRERSDDLQTAWEAAAAGEEILPLPIAHLAGTNCRGQVLSLAFRAATESILKA